MVQLLTGKTILELSETLVGEMWITLKLFYSGFWFLSVFLYFKFLISFSLFEKLRDNT